MEGWTGIGCGVLEGVLWGQVNAVRRPVVERAICLIVEDCRAAVVQNLLGCLDHFEHRPLFRGPFGNAFDLLCVEDGIDAMNESISATLVRLVGGLVSLALSGANWFRPRLAFGFPLPQLKLGSFLSFS